VGLPGGVEVGRQEGREAVAVAIDQETGDR